MSVETTVVEQAIDWLARRQSGDFGLAERRAFEAWWATSPAHVAAYADAERLWDSLAWSEALNLESLALVSSRGRQELAPVRGTARRASAYARTAGMAAGMVLLCLTAFVVHGARMTAPKTFATEVGEIRHLTLRDGSRVSLGGATRMTSDMGGRSRTINLADGDAYFDVAHDKARVFAVTAPGLRAEAVGTAFEVRAAPRGAEVLVTEGRVRVTALRGGRSLLVGPGQRVTATEHGLSLAQVEVSAAAPWRRQRLVFVGAPLAEVADEVNRYYRPGLEIASPEMASRTVTATFNVDQIPEALESLAGGMGARLERRAGQPDRIRLLPDS